MIGYSN